jgi:hypothetical protein
MVACEVNAGSKPVRTGNGSGLRNNNRLRMCAWHRLLKSSNSSPGGINKIWGYPKDTVHFACHASTGAFAVRESPFLGQVLQVLIPFFGTLRT